MATGFKDLGDAICRFWPETSALFRRNGYIRRKYMSKAHTHQTSQCKDTDQRADSSNPLFLITMSKWQNNKSSSDQNTFPEKLDA